MVSSLLLTYIHLRLCEITGKQQLFGGVNILILGDLLQLPPVKGSPPFVRLKAEEIRHHLDSVGAIDLWTTFRQSSDVAYSNILSNVRVGNPSPADITLLRTRVVPGDKSDEHTVDLYQQLVANGDKPICLMSKVQACRQFNFLMLQRLGVSIINIPSIDEFEGVTNTKMKQIAEKRLKQIASDSSRSAGLEAELTEASHASSHALRRNIDMESGLVNRRTMGTIKNFIHNNFWQIQQIEIEFDNSQKMAINIPFELLKGVYVTRKQFPLSLSYAITVH